MTDLGVDLGVEAVEAVGAGRRGPGDVLSAIRHRPATGVGAGILFIVVVLAIAGPELAPQNSLTQHLSTGLQGPGTHHLLGTDQLGRDTLSRLMVATRPTLVTALESTGVAAVLGSLVGIFLGSAGGWSDRIGMRVVEVVMAVPSVLVAFAVLAIFGNNLTVAMLAVGVGFAPVFVRLARARVSAVQEEPFVEAAKVGGLPRWRILVNHVLPSVSGPLVVQTTVVLGASILVEAALNYLGLGVQPPTATWGSLLSNAVGLVGQQWFLPIPPGLAVALTVLGANLLGDGWRDALRSARQVRPVHRPRMDIAAGVPAPRPADVTDSAVSVRNLSVGVIAEDGSATAICDGIDFDLRRREILGVVGESGCGKTSVALSLLGLLPPSLRVDADRLEACGLDLRSRSGAAWRAVRGVRVGMVFQEPRAHLHPHLTIGRQISDALRHQGGLDRRTATGRTLELLEMAEIPDAARVAAAYAHELSGGLAQRALIALALSGSPDVLIADEPTTALDVTVQGEILRLLRRLVDERGLSILFVTHDLGVAAQFCDRTLVMYAGQIIESGPTGELFDRPRHPYTQALIGAVPLIESSRRRLATIPGNVPPPGSRPTGCRFASRCPHTHEECLSPVIERLEDRTTVRCVLTPQPGPVGAPHG